MENTGYTYPQDNVALYPTGQYDRLKDDGTSVTTATVVNMGPTVPPRRDHIIWSIFTTVYMNIFCLGLMALAFSIKSRDRKVLGDMEGAHHYGSTAKVLNIIALVLTILIVALIIGLIAAGVIEFHYAARHDFKGK
ncbi:dispanin subfamily A member 2b-like [Protopterus annectens]|uniref:dispanin subfamily A member 2b-like n=1 Tax=Protopterus annectens TaxID=7888 RepID=UPI001CFA9D37|nr:dispanin subfamily A member 2b-like [Protopterus annectens]